MTPETAPQVFQDYLDRVAAAFFDNAYEVYADSVILPLSIFTKNKTLVVSTTKSLQDGFNSYVAFLKRSNATAMTRRVTSTNLVTDDFMNGTYTTEITNEGGLIVPQFASTMSLQISEDKMLRAVFVMNNFENSTWPIEAPILTVPTRAQPE